MYYIIWVEGLTFKTGEKVKSITSTGVEYTTKMTSSLRFKPQDTHRVFGLLRNRGITNATMVSVTYAPKGTVYNFPEI
jgi:hypothetical protein